MSIASRSVVEINNLRVLRHRSGKRYKAEQVVFNDWMMVARLADGSVATNWDAPSKFAMSPSTDARLDKFIRCLVTLGIITRAQLKAYVAECKESSCKTTVRVDQNILDRLGKKHGFEAPKLAYQDGQYGIITPERKRFGHVVKPPTFKPADAEIRKLDKMVGAMLDRSRRTPVRGQSHG